MTLRSSVEFNQNLTTANIKNECLATVVIPVRNEADHLSATLECFTRQIDPNNQPLSPNLYEIIIFVNNCCDESSAIAHRWRKRNPSLNIHLIEDDLPSEKSNIGYVRRILMNEADRRLRNNRYKSGVIMTTDGDTCVAPNWIAANLHEIKIGADAVGGRILIKPSEIREMSEKARRFHLLDTGYRLLAAELEAHLDYVSHDYLPRHHQHFNGSFAVTTEAFKRAGGIPDVRFLEDVAFYHALLRIDARFRHSPSVRVETSARCVGRTESGLSTQLKQWTVMGHNADDYLVESAQSIKRRVRLRRHLRDLWKSGAKTFSVADKTALADQLFISESVLQTEFTRRQTFGETLENIEREQTGVGEWHKNYPLVKVEKALFDLRRMLEIRRRESHSYIQNTQSFSQTSSR